MQDHRGRSLSFLRWLAIYCKLIRTITGGLCGKAVSPLKSFCAEV